MVLLGLAPDGVCPDGPRHRGPGALLPHLFTFACTRLTCGRAIGRVVSVALSRGFRRVGITDRPCPVVSGLSSRYHPRDRMACDIKCRGDRDLKRAPTTAGGVAQPSSAPQVLQPLARVISPEHTGQIARSALVSSRHV